MLYLNSSQLERELEIDNGGKVHKFFTQTCYKEMIPFVPGGEASHLNQVVTLGVDSISYDSPDAHYLYNGILYVDPETRSSYARKGVTKVPTTKPLEYHTPGTGAHWDMRMWTSKQDEVVKQVQNFIDRG